MPTQLRLILVFLGLCAVSVLTAARFGPPPPEDDPAASGMSAPGTGGMAVPDRLGAPPLPANPSQADLGHAVYYQVCMACHGDRGQGLTDEWRDAWGGDSNCWESKCHGPNHPPHGFSFPKVTSPIVGAGTLFRFENALELHDYLVDTMPWWFPGYLQPDEYWQLTAFLLQEHQALPVGVTLDANNAVIFHLRPSSPLPQDTHAQVLLVGGTFALAAAALAFQNRHRRD
jgi:mono/diheme cytochrome c family protein